jgi:hypothetical protein
MTSQIPSKNFFIIPLYPHHDRVFWADVFKAEKLTRFVNALADFSGTLVIQCTQPRGW